MYAVSPVVINVCNHGEHYETPCIAAGKQVVIADVNTKNLIQQF
jgi:hypothetical protein